MLERVALAIQAADHENAPDGEATGLADDVSDWGAMVAVAATKAMRAPTKAMQRAGADRLPHLRMTSLQADVIWTAMIDAALLADGALSRQEPDDGPANVLNPSNPLPEEGQ